ncbi:MAG: VanZ family protein [Firmicutes bacterium]|nr:VanZ family protein [Bacillota bacterium]
MVSNLILKVFNNIWPMLVVFIVAIALLRFFYLQNHREKFCFYKEFWYLISIVYIWLLFEILTMTELNGASGMNLTPFSEILRYEFGTKMFNYNVLGNMIIFIPFGYLIGMYVNPKKIWPVIITTLITSGVVEFVQLRIGRSFDIDDIILNVIGGIVGYLIFIGASAISKRLPDFLKSDLVKNIICIVLILLFGIYIFGYWGVIF